MDFWIQKLLGVILCVLFVPYIPYHFLRERMQVLDLSGDREMFSVEKANEIAKLIRDNACTLRQAILRTKTYSHEVARIIASEGWGLRADFLAALAEAKNLEYLDLSDIISGLSFDDAQLTCETFAECLKDLHLKYLDLSDNALGPKGVLSCEQLISVCLCAPADL